MFSPSNNTCRNSGHCCPIRNIFSCRNNTPGTRYRFFANPHWSNQNRIRPDESPIIMGFVTAVSTGFGYLTVFAAPACTIVYASGYLKVTDFLRAGWKMVIISTIMVLLAAAVYWPFLGV